jgi:hypothetical protein
MRGVLREALLRQGNEVRPIVDPVGRQMALPFVSPPDKALEQVAGRDNHWNEKLR